MSSSIDLTAAPEDRGILWLASWVGRRQLRRMLTDNLPDPLRSPIEFLLSGELNPEDDRIVSSIETLRSELAKREGEFVSVFSGRTFIESATHRFSQAGTLVRSLPQVAYVSSVLPRWGTFLYLCANATRAKTILELGSSAGISGCYLASARDCHRFITVEGSSELAKLAETHLSRVARNFEVVNASFTDALDRIFPTLRHGVDMAYIDGDKQKHALCRSFERLAPHLNNGSVVVFDDIHWSSEMWEAWQVLRRWKGFSHAITAGRFGVCFWTGDRAEPKTFDLYKFAGVDWYKLKQRLERLANPFSRLKTTNRFQSF
ncbi:MAG: O-methyltransferase [Candidatus Binatia bacterium]